MSQEKTIPLSMQSVLVSDKRSKEMIGIVIDEMTSQTKPNESTEIKSDSHEEMQKREILLVGDSPIMRNFYRKMLESNSFSVYSASDELSAKNYIKRKIPRLVLIDDAGRPNEAEKTVKMLRSGLGKKEIPLLLMLPADVFKNHNNTVKPFVDMCIPKTYTSAILLPSLHSLLSS